MPFGFEPGRPSTQDLTPIDFNSIVNELQSSRATLFEGGGLGPGSGYLFGMRMRMFDNLSQGPTLVSSPSESKSVSETPTPTLIVIVIELRVRTTFVHLLHILFYLIVCFVSFVFPYIVCVLSSNLFAITFCP